MADELDPVTQAFEADVTEYLAAIEDAVTTAQEFATANEEATVALDGVRDSAAEAGAAVADIGAGAATAGEAMGHVRDEVTAAAAALKIYRDEQGKLRNEAGEVITASEAEALALKHIRDQALEASWAVRDLEKYQRDGVLSGLMSSLGSLFSGGEGGGGGGSSALSSIPLIGALAEAPELLIAIVPLVMAVVTEVGALATGFVAAGLGIGSFVALALPAFKQVFGALGDTKQQLAALPGPVQQAVKAVKSLEDGFSKMSKAFEPTAFKVLNEGLTIANQLLPYVGQFAQAAAPAIEQLLGGLSKAVGSPEFKHFMSFLESLAGPVIKAVGSGMAGLAGDVMKLMEQFSKKDVVNAINIAFRLVGFALTVLIGIIKGSMVTWDWITQKALPAVRDAFDTTRHAIATFGHDVATAFDTVRHAVATVGHDIATAFDTVRHSVASIGDAIAKPFEDAFNWIKSNWKLIVSWLVDPIGTAVMEIKDHTHQIAQAFDQMRHDVASILDGARHDIATVWDGIRHDVAAFVDAIPGTVKNAFNDAYQFIKTVDTDILHALQTAWDAVVKAVSTAIGDVLSFFEKLPGQVVSFLAKLPGEMLSIGENVIKGLINGILNAAAQIPSIMAGLASDVASYFTDPLKLFSPSRLFFEHGYNIVQGAINGVKANAPQLLATMRALGTGVGAAGTGSSLAAGAIAPATGSTTHNVNVSVNSQGALTNAYNTPQFRQYLQSEVQESVLRYGQLNPGNGLTTAWGH